MAMAAVMATEEEEGRAEALLHRPPLYIPPQLPPHLLVTSVRPERSLPALLVLQRLRPRRLVATLLYSRATASSRAWG